MDDELPVGVWSLDPETRAALRLDRVRRLMREQDFGEAVIEVEELLDEEPDNPEGLFLLGEGLLELGEAAVALEAYAHHVQITGGDVRSLLGLGITRFETCDLMGAVEALRETLRLDPSQPEAHWYLGLALERLPGAQTEAAQAFAAAHQLEPEGFPLPLQLDEKGWFGAVGAAVARLHPALQEFWNGIEVRLEEWPLLEELRAHDPPIPPTVSGMYVGEPSDEQDPWEVRPRAFRLFRRNLERSRDLDDLVEQLALGLQTEALDWLGVSDPSELEA